MGELINGRTPEEIITGLKCEVPCHKCAYRDHNFMKDNSCSYYVEQDIIALIEYLEAKAPRWISIKDRTPEDGQKVIFINDKFPSITVQGIYHADNTPDTIRVLGFGIGNVTHWMPLPEPPKEDV